MKNRVIHEEYLNLSDSIVLFTSILIMPQLSNEVHMNLEFCYLRKLIDDIIVLGSVKFFSKLHYCMPVYTARNDSDKNLGNQLFTPSLSTIFECHLSKLSRLLWIDNSVQCKYFQLHVAYQYFIRNNHVNMLLILKFLTSYLSKSINLRIKCSKRKKKRWEKNKYHPYPDAIDINRVKQ